MSQFTLGDLRKDAAAFKDLFEKTFARWEIAGDLRRLQQNGADVQAKGANLLYHVAIPKAAPDRDFDNAIWQRAIALYERNRLGAGWSFPTPNDQAMRLLETAIMDDPRPIRHHIILATPENWGARLTRYTGPAGYWNMMLWRLKEQKTLTLQHGMVSAFDRRDMACPRLVPIKCPEERDFFRLARTKFVHPWRRLTQPREWWGSGIQPPWYPPGLKVYADPVRDRGMYDTSRPVRK